MNRSGNYKYLVPTPSIDKKAYLEFCRNTNSTLPVCEKCGNNEYVSASFTANHYHCKKCEYGFTSDKLI